MPLLPQSAAPWYLHPVTDPAAWARLRAGTVGLGFAVVNVDSGPGERLDPDYREALAGVATPLVGYVNVAYGRRSSAAVLADFGAWQERYGVHGVMLDQVPVAPAGQWRLELIDQLRAAGAGLVVANPGCPVAAELVLRADVTCVAEMGWAAYQEHEAPDPGAEPARVWHLIHSCPPRWQAEALARAAAGGAGWVWATAGRLPNPWQTLQAGR